MNLQQVIGTQTATTQQFATGEKDSAWLLLRISELAKDFWRPHRRELKVDEEMSEGTIITQTNVREWATFENKTLASVVSTTVIDVLKCKDVGERYEFTQYLPYRIARVIQALVTGKESVMTSIYQREMTEALDAMREKGVGEKPDAGREKGTTKKESAQARVPEPVEAEVTHETTSGHGGRKKGKGSTGSRNESYRSRKTRLEEADKVKDTGPEMYPLGETCEEVVARIIGTSGDRSSRLARGFDKIANPNVVALIAYYRIRRQMSGGDEMNRLRGFEAITTHEVLRPAIRQIRERLRGEGKKNFLWGLAEFIDDMPDWQTSQRNIPVEMAQKDLFDLARKLQAELAKEPTNREINQSQAIDLIAQYDKKHTK